MKKEMKLNGSKVVAAVTVVAAGTKGKLINAKRERGLKNALRYYSPSKVNRIYNRISILTHSLGRLRRDLNNPHIKLSDLSQMFPVVLASVLNPREKRSLIYRLFMTISKNPQWTRERDLNNRG